MNLARVLLVFAALFCIMTCTLPCAGQITFEREINAANAYEVIRDQEGTYYMLTVSGGTYSYFGIAKMDQLGRQSGQTLIRDFDITSYSNRFYDFCLTASGIAAVGAENSSNLVLFTCTTDLEDRQIKLILNHPISEAKFTLLADNGYAVLANFQSSQDNWDLKLLRLDANGNVLWSEIFAEANTLSPVDVYEASNGELILVANHYSEGLIIRTSSDGALISKKIFNGADQLVIIDSDFKGDELYLLGSAANTSCEFLHIDKNDEVADRDVLFTADFVSHDSRFSLNDEGDLALVTVAWPSKGFNLMLFNASRQIKNTVLFERGSAAEVFTQAKSIVSAPDGFFITAKATDALAIKTDLSGGTGPPPPFQEIEDPGIPYTYSTHHYTWVDLENDGKKELIVAAGSVKMFSFDDASGKFSEITVPLPGDLTDTRGFSVCDFNNDGANDLYAIRYSPGVNGGYYSKPNILFKNNGNGTFTAITDRNINDSGSSTMQSIWVDINKDGYQDLFTVNIDRDRAYLNNGNETFTEFSSSNFEEKIDWIYSTHYAFTDINEDGFTDYIASQNLQIDVMLNIEGKRFEKHGLLEYFDFSGSFNMPSGIYAFASGQFGGKKCAILMDGRGSYFEHDGTLFRQKAMPAGLESRNNPTKGLFIDFDNDGDLDTYLNGSNTYDIRTDVFNRNDNETGFTYYRGFFHDQFSSFTFTDVDRNGAPDLIGENRMLKNKSSNNWLTVRLKGHASPSMGDGAVVSVKANGKWASLRTSTHAGHNGRIEYESSFGLNKAETADSVKIQWPSGCVSIRTNVTSNEILVIEENCSGVPPEFAFPPKICTGESLNGSFTSSGKKFLWFTDLSSSAIAETGSEVQIDTLTRPVTLFVANGDSSLLSRRVPVHFNVVSPPEFVITSEQSGNNLEFSIVTDDAIDSFEWTIDDQFVSDFQSFTYPFETRGIITACGKGTFKGCTTTKCTELIITSLDASPSGYKAYPNPFDHRFVLENEGGTSSTVEIFNTTGSLVSILNSMHGTLIEVNMDGHPAGVYFVRVNGRIFFKIIKVK